MERLPQTLERAAHRLLQMDKLEALYHHVRTGPSLASQLMRELNIRIEITPEDTKKIPTSGPVLAVSNHPFGLLDGALLTSFLTGVRSDVRVLTNRVLRDLPELGETSIFIDPFERPETRIANGRALRQALEHLKNGGMLLIFPAGEVAHFDFKAAAIRDPEWRCTAARLARIARAKVLPIHVSGSNGIPFQMLGMVHPRLRTAALPAELLNKRNKTVEVRIGGIIDQSELKSIPDDAAAIRYMRLRTDLLARRFSHRVAAPTVDVPISDAVPTEELRREIETLSDGLLESAGPMEVYIASADRIPRALQEIGRLREVTFRTAGEGTGHSRDLDRFDPHYLHLFIWNREAGEIVGAYRMGDVPRLLRQFGRKGLYTESLFKFSPGYIERLGPTLELGRSFIRPEYQRQFAPLLLLWKGIAAYVWSRPEYATLIGAVSVSNQYSKASRELIGCFFEKRRPGGTYCPVKPRRPLRQPLLHRWEIAALCSLLPAVDDLSAPIADLEPDGKGIPILIKQYVKLGGNLLAFSVDPRFGNTLDGFVVLDLRSSPPEILTRYMGKERTARFRAWHASQNPRVA
ncbi:MAG TPA: GNAT family N-acyltransferase [Bryobacteraceae bacterium]|nr:GNAT family N-acyltransferase [Bryobacteraceae bacterium]